MVQMLPLREPGKPVQSTDSQGNHEEQQWMFPEESASISASNQLSWG
jgi:hypothetical protein